MRWLNKVSVPTECSAETGKALEKVFFGSVASDWMSSGSCSERLLRSIKSTLFRTNIPGGGPVLFVTTSSSSFSSSFSSSSSSSGKRNSSYRSFLICSVMASIVSLTRQSAFFACLFASTTNKIASHVLAAAHPEVTLLSCALFL